MSRNTTKKQKFCNSFNNNFVFFFVYENDEISRLFSFISLKRERERIYILFDKCSTVSHIRFIKKSLFRNIKVMYIMLYGNQKNIWAAYGAFHFSCLFTFLIFFCINWCPTVSSTINHKDSVVF